MKTLVGVVLDRSGSMATIADDTIGGFNSFLEEQRRAGLEQLYVVAQFDNEYEVLQDGVELDDVELLSRRTFVPRGGTALLDAIGRTMSALDALVARDPDIERVIMVILTDGGENASTEFTRDVVFDLIKTRRESGKWEFNFLGANQDAITVGGGLGIQAANCMNYAANAGGTQQAFHAVTHSVSLYSTGGSANLNSPTPEETDENQV